MKRFTIAHISDIHLPLESIQFPKLSLVNKRFLSFLSWKKRRLSLQKKRLDIIIDDISRESPDLLLISGDLTNLALPEEFKQAADWLHHLPFKNINIIPGNHDALVKTQWHNSYAFWSPWSQAYNHDDYPIIARYGSIAVIGINTAVPTPPFFANGQVGNYQLNQIRYALQRLKKDNLFRIVILHHPPVSGIVSERKALKDRKKLQKILYEEGVEIILFGHVHRTITRKFLNTNIPMLGIASASSNSSRPYHQAAWRKIVIEKLDDHFHTFSTVRFIDKNGDFSQTHSFYIDHYFQ